MAKITVLLGELLDRTKNLLPVSFIAQTQGLARLFKLASTFEDEQIRHQATAVLLHIDSWNKRKQKASVAKDEWVESLFIRLHTHSLT